MLVAPPPYDTQKKRKMRTSQPPPFVVAASKKILYCLLSTEPSGGSVGRFKVVIVLYRTVPYRTVPTTNNQKQQQDIAR